MGRTEEAKKALEKANPIAPRSFGMHVRGRVPWARPEDWADILEGLRKPGGGMTRGPAPDVRV